MKGSEMTNGIFFSFSEAGLHSVGGCSPMSHLQSRRYPQPGHRCLRSQPRGHSGLLDVPFWPMLQFFLHPTRLPQHLSHQPLRLLCVRSLQPIQICIHAHNCRSSERYWIASEMWSEVSLSDPARSAMVRATFKMRS